MTFAARTIHLEPEKASLSGNQGQGSSVRYHPRGPKARQSGMSENDWPRPGHVLRWFILAVVILAIVWIALPAFFFVLRPTSSSFYPFYRPFFFPFGLLFGIFLIFIFFGVLRWIFWPWRYRRRYWGYRDESYYILRQRYARGEITKEQFQQMMRDLEETQK